jgi:two-component system, chemotaxis family, protein-glutamate methylesterase/glutaminase
VIIALIADGASWARTEIRRILESEHDIAICGEAEDAADCLKLVRKFRPHVVLMHANLPGGVVATTEEIMRELPTAIVVLDDAKAPSETGAAFSALQAGAVEIARRPLHEEVASPRNSTRLVNSVRLASRVKLVRRRIISTIERKPKRDATIGGAIIAIAASTGGPPAVLNVLNAMPANVSAPILVVQHMIDAFSEQFAAWLAGLVPQRLEIVVDGRLLEPGCIYVAKEGLHLAVDARGAARLIDSPPVGGHRPAATVLFESLACCRASLRIGVVLTGMGEDGAAGLVALRRSGGYTIAQDERSCVVFGMPQAAIAKGAINEVAALDSIGPRLVALLGSGSSQARSADEA